MAPDYYADARALASDLADAHLPIWAQRIENMMTSGSTGTEILMGLRWTLDQLVETEAVLPEHLRSRATSLADALETATS